MNRWEERIKDHGIWAALQEFGPQLNEAAKIDDAFFGGANKDDIARLKLILTLVGKRLEATDSMLIAISPLTRIEEQFRTAISEVTLFTQTHAPEYLENANNHLDPALVLLSEIGIPSTSDDLGPLRIAAIEYRDELDRQRTQSQQAVNELTAAYSQLRKDYKTAAESVQKEAESLAQQVHLHSENLNNEVTSIKGRADAFITGMQSQFSHAQEWRQSEFASHQTIWTNTLTAMKEQMSDDWRHLYAGEVAQSQALLHDMEERRSEIEKLVGVIGNLGMTSGFQKEASEARRQAILWQGMTVTSIVFLIVWLAMPILSSFTGHHESPLLKQASEPMQWLNIASRLLVAVAFGVLSRYSATQADRYLAIQRTNRKLELELQALGPYLAPLPTEQQQTFRLGLAKKVFGRQDSHHTGKVERSPATLIDVLATEETRDVIDKLIPLLKEPEFSKAVAEAFAALVARKA